MSLTKLVILGGAGYLIYRYARTLSQAGRNGEHEQKRTGYATDRPLTGRGGGVTEFTLDGSGESTPHRVGRGVVRQ